MEKAYAQREIWIKGGGLAGCFLFAAIRHAYPLHNVRLFEKADTLGGSHTWSFHEHDVPPSSWSWLRPLLSHSWPAYNVRFPTHSRHMKSAYHSIRSEDLHRKLFELYSRDIFLNVGETDWRDAQLEAKTQSRDFFVIEACGWPVKAAAISGYQKFVGLEIELESPHQMTEVLLKDATVEQRDGYRFVYILPWTPRTFLVEDTYYSISPDLDVLRLEAGIELYVSNMGFKIKKILRKEVGCLPLALYEEPAARGLTIGAASGLAHPVTGYTTPQTLRTIQAFIEKKDPTEKNYEEALSATRSYYKSDFRYFRLLNRMMFLAADPDKRYKILERFYRLSPALIDRFYSGHLTTFDKVRILAGKPPVALGRAIRVLWGTTP